MARRSPQKAKSGTRSMTRASPSKHSTVTSPARFQALLRRPSLDVTWGFLTYKSQWPLCVGSVTADPAFVVAPASVAPLVSSLAAEGMLFTAPTDSTMATGAQAPAYMPITGLGVTALQKGDVILGLNGVRLRTRDEANEIFQSAQLLLTVLVEREAALASPQSSTTPAPAPLPRPDASAADLTRTPKTLLADLPRPGGAGGTMTAITPTASAPASLIGAMPPHLSSLPRPPGSSQSSTTGASTVTSRFGLPAPPSHAQTHAAPSAASPIADKIADSDKDKDKGKDKDASTTEEEEEGEEGEEFGQAAVSPRKVAAPSPVPVRASLELLTRRGVLGDLSAAALLSPPSSAVAHRGWQDPLQPLYHYTSAAAAEEKNASDPEKPEREDRSPPVCDVFGGRVDDLTISAAQCVARAVAMRQALGSSSRGAAAIGTAAANRDASSPPQDVDTSTPDADPAAVAMAVHALPVTVRSAVYDRSGCPFNDSDGFTEEFHRSVQSTVTRLALRREDRLPTDQTGHEAKAEASVVDMLLNGRYDLVLYAQKRSQQRQEAQRLRAHDTAATTSAPGSRPNEAGEEESEETLRDKVLCGTPSPSTTPVPLGNAQQACQAVMESYAAGRRDATAAQQEHLRHVQEDTERWRDEFKRFMRQLAERQQSHRDGRDDRQRLPDHSDDDDDDDSASPGQRKRQQKMKRKRAREERTQQREQRQAYATMAQLLTQLQGRTQPHTQPHAHPPVGSHYYPSAQRQSPPPQQRRVDGAGASVFGPRPRSPESLGQTTHVYRPPQFPSMRGTASHATAPGSPSSEATREKPGGRFGLPAPPPPRGH